MPIAYTKEFLVNAALFPFECLGEKSVNNLRTMFDQFYDKVGKNEFRKYTSLSAEAIKKYKEHLSEKGSGR